MMVSVENAAAIVRAGGVVACPTEAVFGLSCDPRDKAAVSRVLSLKNRFPDKGLILIGAGFSQFEDFCVADATVRWEAVRATWPGPHTWLFRASADCPAYLRGAHTTVAVRVTAHAVASRLCSLSDTALVSTSANASGCPPARVAREVAAAFGERIDGIVEGETDGDETVTSIRDAVTCRVIR